MRRAARVVVVTIGLVAAGFIFGALAGGAAFAMVVLVPGEGPSLWAFGIGAFYGAPLGAVTAPLLSWLLLRRVPLGRMFLVCSIGTTIGGIGGWFSAGSADILLTPIMGAFAGCLIAALGLHLRVHHVSRA